jgi:hypothetical protein
VSPGFARLAQGEIVISALDVNAGRGDPHG